MAAIHFIFHGNSHAGAVQVEHGCCCFFFFKCSSESSEYVVSDVREMT